MAEESQYQQIVSAYHELGSIIAVAQKLGISEVKVRRILITEGLWSSRTSREIARLLLEGLSVEEIAARINISANAVRAYMPYRRGLYNESEQSPEAARSDNYRKRKAANAEKANRPEAGTPADVRQKIESMDRSSVSADRLYSEIMEKPPRVMRLRLALDTDGADPDILHSYGKAKDGIIREVLVPADITLHALHYVIQRAFGWTNSHLHHFCFTEETQNALLTAVADRGHERPTYSDWEKLAGVYFRFPTDDDNDIYWDDDYDGEESVKTWYRRKYRAPYRYEGFSEHYLECRNRAARFREKNPVIRPTISFTEYREAKEENRAPEKAMLPIGEVAYADMRRTLESNMDELLERLPLIDLVFPARASRPEGWQDQVRDTAESALTKAAGTKTKLRNLQAAIVRAVKLFDKDEYAGYCAYESAFNGYKRFVGQYDPAPVPLDSTIRYLYDYGDGWEVLIHCVEAYYTKDGFGHPASDMPAGWVTVAVSNESLEGLSKGFNSENSQVDESLSGQIAEVKFSGKPLCILADGLDVMDDVGGIHGFCDFLMTIHEGSDEEKEEYRTWARGQGWTGRKVKTENIL